MSLHKYSSCFCKVGENIDNYQCFPRLIGECGGKNYHLVHHSADLDSVAMGTIRSAFEYGGQKCSALSRMYVAESVWPDLKSKLLKIHKDIKMSSPLSYDTFFSAVIDEKAFDRISSFIDYANESSNLEVVAGGKYDKSKGYFIQPTIIETKDPHDKIMKTELFGPVLTVYVYPDNQDFTEVMELVRDCVLYALTGSIYAKDRMIIEQAREALKPTAGNFYINDKSTGSVVGQQPFGGAKLSGTNDKAGGPHYLLRFSSPQATKETFVPLKTWKYPYMED